MSTLASPTTADTVARLFALVEELRPIIAAHQREADQLRHLPPAIVQGFADRGLMQAMLPVDLGGYGVDPVTCMRLVEAVAAMDGSAGWNFSIGVFSQRWVGFLPEAWGREFLASPGAMVAPSLNPVGRAVAVPGGYRVSGRFPFSSGVYQANWVAGGCRVFDGDEQRRTADGGAVAADALMPQGAVSIIDGWQVSGMRGTGSTGFVADDVFVPEEHLVVRGGKPRRNDPIFHFGVPFGSQFAMVTLGIARCAIEAFIDLSQDKQTRPWMPKLRDTASAHYDVAKAQAQVEAGGISLLAGIGEMWDACVAGEEMSVELRAKVRRAQVHAAESAMEAVDRICRAAGATSLFEAYPFERCLRDVHGAIAQIHLQRGSMEDAGRVAFGLKPLNPLF